MNVVDWREAPADVVAPVFERERLRWLQTLQWDPSRAWHEIERARTTWGLPGHLALDERGRAVGSIFYLPDSARFEIGGVTADTPAATAALLDRVLAAAACDGVREVRCFAFESAASLRRELAARGFCVEPYLYLSADLDGERALEAAYGSEPGTAPAARGRHDGPALETRGWRSGDAPDVAALLRDAYGLEGGRVFAPLGTIEEWAVYLQNLVDHDACGELNAHATRVARLRDAGRAGGRVVGTAIVTAIAPRTAHIAQFAVHPAVQRRGMARTLLAQACGIAAEQGFSTATLLVAEGNGRARALYDSMGFRRAAAFVAATWGAAAGG